MATLIARIRIMAMALGMLALVGLVGPAGAQQINPTAESVSEKQLLREIGGITGRCTLPDQKACTIEQAAGREWRAFHEVTLKWIGAIAIFGTLGLLLLFHFLRGVIRIEAGRSGRLLVRFSAFERFVHWMTASCFVILALSGLNMTFGKHLLLPVIGPQAFAAWSQWAKYAHNYLSLPFTLGVVLMLLMWIVWNFPTLTDLRWIWRGGGMIQDTHPPADRFNAGQKLFYWFVVLGGGVAVASGYALMFPFYATDLDGMQTAQVVHGILGVAFVAVILAHVYFATIGVEGTFEGMGTGDVDASWAQQHHSAWFDREAAKGHVAPPPRQRWMRPAE
jgi:formate dehydrogenase subunit gamma